jgi:hypothetical protein
LAAGIAAMEDTNDRSPDVLIWFQWVIYKILFIWPFANNKKEMIQATLKGGR